MTKTNLIIYKSSGTEGHQKENIRLKKNIISDKLAFNPKLFRINGEEHEYLFKEKPREDYSFKQ